MKKQYLCALTCVESIKDYIALVMFIKKADYDYSILYRLL